MAFTPEIAADEEREHYISPPSPMGFTPETAVDEPSRELYKALMHGEKERVLQLCQEFPDGPLHVVTIHQDTVLHVATSCKQANLVRDLLKMIKDDQLGKLTIQNKVGNTILHEASTSDKFVEAAEEMLNKAPELLNMCNKFGVTPLYRSVVFGRMDMFKFFDKKIRTQKQTMAHGDLEADLEVYYHKTIKTTILHTAVVNGSFDLALLIAKRYIPLVSVVDNNGMTALQLLACNSLAFKRRAGGGYLKRLMCSCTMTALQLLACNSLAFKRRAGGGYLKRLMCSCVLTGEMSTGTEAEATEDTAQKEAAGCWRVPYLETIREEREIYESAMKLAKFLIKEDTSWISTKAMENQSDPRHHKYGDQDSSSESSSSPREKKRRKRKTVTRTVIPETPLILATKNGCVEMVKEILEVHPWAVEHVDYQGRTILHVAIKFRQMEVLDLVEQMGVLMSRLVRKVDNNLNTILHMVGDEPKYRIVPVVRSPAFELQENLLLFERVLEICPSSLEDTINKKKKTAQQLFQETNEPLRERANDWLKRTAENCSIVAVLIATVAFAAAYTIPGGPNQSTGFPILLDRPLFVVFTMADVLSLTFALTSVIIFLRIHTSSFHLEDFKQSLPQMLMLGITFLILSVTMMMFAFAATVVLMIHSRGEWTKVALYTASFLPVSIFAVSYLPLYLSLMKTFNYSLKKVAMIFPKFTGCPHKSKPEQIETSNSTCPPKLRASPNLV